MALFIPMSNKALMGISLLLVGVLLPNALITDAQPIGVCYGRIADNLPPPQDVISLYKANGISKMRLYDPNPDVFEALRGSDIELMLDVPNEQIQNLASDASAAQDWVQKNIKNYSPDVKFKYIAVGNEINPKDPITDGYAQFVGPAMENIHSALADAGLQDQIKVSTATFPALLANPYPPSNAVFRDDAESFIEPIIDLLLQFDSPLLLNVYPYFSYIYGNGIKIEYALFTSAGIVVQDGSLGYQNLFDAILDSFYTALEKEGASDIEIVVSESGWPSDEGPAATTQNAATYYRNLIGHVKSGSGTPKKYGRTIETYLFAMFDENRKTGAATERHFGLFFPNKMSKYNINLN